jgi:hypothetical protein
MSATTNGDVYLDAPFFARAGDRIRFKWGKISLAGIVVKTSIADQTDGRNVPAKRVGDDSNRDPLVHVKAGLGGGKT